MDGFWKPFSIFLACWWFCFDPFTLDDDSATISTNNPLLELGLFVANFILINLLRCKGGKNTVMTSVLTNYVFEYFFNLQLHYNPGPAIVQLSQTVSGCDYKLECCDMLAQQFGIFKILDRCRHDATLVCPASSCSQPRHASVRAQHHRFTV